jgi:hypothetical protein
MARPNPDLLVNGDFLRGAEGWTPMRVAWSGDDLAPVWRWSEADWLAYIASGMSQAGREAKT